LFFFSLFNKSIVGSLYTRGQILNVFVESDITPGSLVVTTVCVCFKSMILAVRRAVKA